MGKIQDLYNASVKPMVPAERLQLARLILDDLAPSGNAVDVSDEWGDDDLAEAAAYSAQHGTAVRKTTSEKTTGGGAGNESR